MFIDQTVTIYMYNILWPEQMDDILQTTFSNEFYWKQNEYNFTEVGP